MLLAFIPCAWFKNEIFTAVAQPLLAKLPKGGTLIATGVISPFMTPFKLAFFVALFLAMPFVLYQAWAFVAPGSTCARSASRFRWSFHRCCSSMPASRSPISSSFPVMFQFFAQTTPQGVALMTDIANYMDFVLAMFLAFGAAFEVPVAVVLLVLTGLVSVEKLKASRGYVLIGVFVVAAVLTPPDAISQCIMAVPMYLLYEGGLLMARLLGRR